MHMLRDMPMLRGGVVIWASPQKGDGGYGCGLKKEKARRVYDIFG
jgi:hypothetical protein